MEKINNKASTILLFTLALRPRGPRHPNAATPSAISLRSIHAFGVTALVKAANAVTFLWYFLLVEAKESTIDQKVIIFEVPIISLRWGTLRENKNNFLVSPLLINNTLLDFSPRYNTFRSGLNYKCRI